MLRLHYACHCGLAWRRQIPEAAPAAGDHQSCPRCHAGLLPHWYETVSLPQGASAVGLVLVGALSVACLAAALSLAWRMPAVMQWAGL